MTFPARRLVALATTFSCALLVCPPRRAHAADGGSAKARAKSWITILGHPVAFIPRFANGGSVSLNLGSRIALEGFYEYGAYKVSGFRSRRTRMGGRALLFTDNSLFLSLGAAHDATDDRRTRHWTDITAWNADGEWKGTYEQIDAEIGLGNRWQWDSGFTLSATWVGYSRGVEFRGRESSHTGVSDAEAKAQDDDLERTSERGGIHFAKIGLGISF